MKLNLLLKKIVALLSLGFLLLSASANAGQSFTTYKTYDFSGHVTSVINSRANAPYPATINIYQQGLLVTVETGTWNGPLGTATLPDNWSAYFTPLIIQNIAYDDVNRKSSEQTTGVTNTETSPVTEYAYDDYNRPTCVAKRMGGSITGNACSGGANGDRVTTYNYEDTFGNVTAEHRAVGSTDEQIYVTNWHDSNGRITDQIDANNNRTHLEYYPNTDRLKTMYFPSKTATNTYSTTDMEGYAYDNNGNRTSLIKRDTRTINYVYDALNRVILKDLPTGTNGTSEDVITDYDLLNFKISDVYGAGSGGRGVQRTFDGFGEVTDEKTNANGPTYNTHNDYDMDGNRTQITYPDGKTFSYTYDDLDRSVDIIEGGGPTLSHNEYDDFARPISQTTMGNSPTSFSGAQTSLSYDSLSRVNNIGLSVAGNIYDLSSTFSYNPFGQMLTQAYNNDLYEYKEKGSKTGTYTVNGLNQYTCVGTAPNPNCDTKLTYKYDANGNLTSDGSVTYNYDIENRLSYTTGGSNVTLKYDTLGRLYSIYNASQSTYFLYNGDSLIAEYQNNVMIRRYVFGVGVDKPVVSYIVNQAVPDPRQFLHSNYQGSVIGATDSTGNIIYVNTYDAYGVPGAVNQGRFAYTGQTYLAELGMYYYKARLYNPGIGRFMQVDPIGYKDDYDLYTYVGDDPVNKTDPTGLEKYDIGISIDLVVKVGIRAGLSISYDTKNYEVGVSGNVGPRAGLSVGVGFPVNVTPSSDTPAASKVEAKLTANADFNVGPLGGGKELGSISSSDDKVTMGGDAKGTINKEVKVGLKPELKFGASVGVEASVTKTTDAVAKVANAVTQAIGQSSGQNMGAQGRLANCTLSSGCK